MKKTILILLIVLFSGNIYAGWFKKDKEATKTAVESPKEKYWTLDPVRNVYYVFAILDGQIQQVGIVDFTEYKIIHLKKNLRPKSTWNAEGETINEKRENIEQEFMKLWPDSQEIKYYQAE